jgi:hypothetical protein
LPSGGVASFIFNGGLNTMITLGIILGLIFILFVLFPIFGAIFFFLSYGEINIEDYGLYLEYGLHIGGVLVFFSVIVFLIRFIIYLIIGG